MNQEMLNYQRVRLAIEYLAAHFKSQPDLKTVAEKVHLSPYHFQRIFTEWAGVSPKKFLQYLTLDYLKSRIQEIGSVAEMAEMVGLSAQSRVYDLFVSLEGVTPQLYKKGGEGLQVHYGYHATPFGMCFLAASEKGICALSFVDETSERTEYEAFAAKWHFAQLQHNPQYTQQLVQQIFNPSHRLDKLHLLVQGTNFQLKVWEALLRIPAGALSTYEQIARSIGHPKAMRAVGSAIGDNPIAYLIPCHRIIRKEGKIGGYQWGTARKSAIIGWEMSSAER
jgi:AraC family transcriptional regulator of adaptative response/methylated-DNA-[protein]-cysteine methyltransferase